MICIGARIKLLRNKAGMSQVSLADAIGVSKQTLYKYENGIVTNIPADKIQAIAKICNTTPAYIMGWTVRDEDVVHRTLGEIIKAYRTEQGMSMDDFSKASGISKAYISVLEKNKHPGSGKPVEPSVKCVKQAAKAMGVDFIELILAISEE